MPKPRITRATVAVCALFFTLGTLVATPAAAQYVSRYTGTFDGTEPTFNSPYAGGTSTGYSVVGPITTSVSGNYRYGDVSIGYDIDMQVDIYVGSFDPLNPGTNYVDGFDDWGTFTMTAGTDYYVVVGPLSGGTTTGTWDFILVGGQDLTGSGDTTFSGTLDGTEPTFASPYCGSANEYDVLGPLSVSVSGDYYYTDMSIAYDVDMQIDLYEGSFDPADPTANYVGGGDDHEAFTLTAGVEYYAVLSALCGSNSTGTWEFALVGDGSVEVLSGVSIPVMGLYGTIILVLLMVAVAFLIIRRHLV